MKIGAGGPPAQAGFEAGRTLDAARLRPPAEEALVQEDLALRRAAQELNKAVAQLNRAAAMHNLPLDFAVRERQGRPRIFARDRRTGAERELSPEEARAWLEGVAGGPPGGVGQNLNGYA